MDGQMVGWKDGWTDGWMEGRMDRWTDANLIHGLSKLINLSRRRCELCVCACACVCVCAWTKMDKEMHEWTNTDKHTETRTCTRART